jgi:hypothetical protein
MSIDVSTPKTVMSGTSPRRDAQRATTASSRGAERRWSARGVVGGEPSRTHLVALILGTYSEMPGLSLYLPQAARLFGLRDRTCQVIFDDLVREGRLRQSPDGQFRGATGGQY